MNKFIKRISGNLPVFLLTGVFAGSILLGACQTAKVAPVETAAPTPSPRDEINRPTSEPYKGDLSIFEGEDRAKNLQIDRVMDILKITENKTVADIGAGSGWFTVRAAARVGGKGKVYAVEISPDAIKYIQERAKKENLPQIETIVGTEDDAKLPANSTDAVLILKTYHEIAQPVLVLENLRKALKPGALIGIIDRNGNGEDHGIDKEQVVEEAKRAGYALQNDYDFVKPDGMDYFLVFSVAETGK